MDIIKKPQTLSLAGNMSPLVVSSAYDIHLVMVDEAGTELLSHVYTPGTSSPAEIDLRPSVIASMTFNLKNQSEPYEQNGIAKNITVTVKDVYQGSVINTETVRFAAVRAGVDELSEDPSEFLKQNFLTWQPTVKPVTYYTPEFLTYYAVVTSNIIVKAVMEDKSEKRFIADTVPAGQCHTIPMQYAIVAGKCGSLPVWYDVWAEDSAGTRLSYVQRYYAQDMRSEQEQWILFENSLGGIDTFRAYGEEEKRPEYTHNISEYGDELDEYRVDTQRKHVKHTGYLDKDERRWLMDFFPSAGKYIYAGDHIRRIVVTESDAAYVEIELPSDFSFTYRYRESNPYLHLQRTDVPLEMLNIHVPDVGSFTIAPRLAEFQKLPLSGGALIPVQDPYAEEWNATSMSEILQYIIDNISVAGGGEGGTGHQHYNMSVLKAIGYLAGYLTYGGEKIRAGYADEAATISKDSELFDQLRQNYLSRKTDDSAEGFIRFLSGLQSDKLATFAQGARFGKNFVAGITGEGGMIDGKGNAWLRNLDLSESLTVPKLSYNIVEICPGVQWQSAGGGTIKSVEIEKDADGNDTMNGIVTLDLKDGEIGQVKEGDLCLGIFHSTLAEVNETEDKETETGIITRAGFYTCYFRVTDIMEGEFNSKFRYVMRSDDEWSKTVHPSPQMTFVVFGNPTYEDRQKSCYRATNYTRYLAGVTTWKMGVNNIACQIGDLSNLNQIQGYEFLRDYSGFFNNIYITGHVEEIEDMRSEVVMSGIEDNRIEVGGSRTLTFSLRFQNKTVDGATWKMVRESGLAEADAEWNAAHTDVSSPMVLTSDDMGDGAYLQGVMFTLTGSGEYRYVTGKTVAVEASKSMIITLLSRDELWIDFVPVEGKSFVVKASNVDTIVEARLMYGNTDITDSILLRSSSEMEWTRDSGIPEEDNAWVATVGDSPNIIHIIDRANERHDCGSYWMQKLKVSFTFTCKVIFAAEPVTLTGTLGIGNQ